MDFTKFELELATLISKHEVGEWLQTPPFNLAHIMVETMKLTHRLNEEFQSHTGSETWGCSW